MVKSNLAVGKTVIRIGIDTEDGLNHNLLLAVDGLAGFLITDDVTVISVGIGPSAVCTIEGIDGEVKSIGSVAFHETAQGHGVEIGAHSRCVGVVVTGISGVVIDTIPSLHVGIRVEHEVVVLVSHIAVLRHEHVAVSGSAIGRTENHPVIGIVGVEQHTRTHALKSCRLGHHICDVVETVGCESRTYDTFRELAVAHGKTHVFVRTDLVLGRTEMAGPYDAVGKERLEEDGENILGELVD